MSFLKIQIYLFRNFQIQAWGFGKPTSSYKSVGENTLETELGSLYTCDRAKWSQRLDSDLPLQRNAHFNLGWTPGTAIFKKASCDRAIRVTVTSLQLLLRGQKKSADHFLPGKMQLLTSMADHHHLAFFPAEFQYKPHTYSLILNSIAFPHGDMKLLFAIFWPLDCNLPGVKFLRIPFLLLVMTGRSRLPDIVFSKRG